jgi:hypothetical protein
MFFRQLTRYEFLAKLINCTNLRNAPNRAIWVIKNNRKKLETTAATWIIIILWRRGYRFVLQLSIYRTFISGIKTIAEKVVCVAIVIIMTEVKGTLSVSYIGSWALKRKIFRPRERTHAQRNYHNYITFPILYTSTLTSQLQEGSLEDLRLLGRRGSVHCSHT